MSGHTAWTDLALALIYIVTPTIFYLFHGDKKPAPIDGMARNT